MAFRHCLSYRGTIMARRYQPSFAYLHHEDDRQNQPSNEFQSHSKSSNCVHRRCFGTGFSNSWSGFGMLFQDRMCSRPSLLPSSGVSSFRNMSTSVNNEADNFELIDNVTKVLKDSAVEAVATQAPAVNEVAIAAADCWLPVATLQYAIDAIHSFTGLNWWASIAVTTLLIRGATFPLLINQLKATAKIRLMRPRLEDITEQMQSKGEDSLSMSEGQNEMKKLFKAYGVTTFTPLKGLFIRGPIFVCSYIAITTMAEKMPSFECGGAYWFTDLTTPDSLYVLPVLSALTVLITVECIMQGMKGNPARLKLFFRVLAVLTVQVTMTFPKAIFFCWITSNLISLSYGLMLRAPGVKKALGIPQVPHRTSPPRPIDLSSALKVARTIAQESASVPAASTKVSNKKT